MTRHKNSNAVSLPTGYTKSHRQIRESVAWHSISPIARLLIIELESFYRGGPVYMSCDMAAELLSVSRSTAWRAFRELRKVGFISVYEQSNFLNKSATYYRLEWAKCNGREPSKAWMSHGMKNKTPSHP